MESLEEVTTVVTPFMTLRITKDGREINIKMHGDIRKGEHTSAVYKYFEKLVKMGIKNINADHIKHKLLNKSLKLDIRGKRPDIIYMKDGKIIIVEIKTRKSLGKDQTRKQLEHWIKWDYKIVLAVPGDSVEEAHEIVNVLGMEHKVDIDYY